jgi:diketogulonate reductase-like aldo/keto reductase
MRHEIFGPTDRPVPVIGQGTWTIEANDRQSVIDAIRAGLDAGMTHIDTAEMYGSGAAEEIVGDAIAGRREELFIVSKVLPQNASRAGTRAACERSLRRLRTDRLDCYLLHWPGPHPLEDTLAAFELLKAEGKIASWGVSNFDVDELDDVETLGLAHAMACNQVLYHLKERVIEHSVIPWCEARGVAVAAYSPFGSGDFPDVTTPGGRALAAIAEARDATARQVALAFLTRRPSVFAVPKAASKVHALDNARAGDISLAADEIARIEEAFTLGRVGRLPML